MNGVWKVTIGGALGFFMALAALPGGCLREPVVSVAAGAPVPAQAPPDEPRTAAPVWARSGPADGPWLRCPPGAYAEWREPILGSCLQPRCVLEPIRGPGR